MDEKLRSVYIKSIVSGLLGIIFFGTFYLILFSFFMTLQGALFQIQSIKYWLLILLIGLGIQISLFVYVRSAIKHREDQQRINAMLATSGGINTTSMIACCMHHLTDFLPLLGIGFLSVFALKFQTWFLLFGIFSNLFGILFMLNHIKKHKLIISEKELMSKLIRYDLSKFTKIYLIIALIILFIYGGFLL